MKKSTHTIKFTLLQSTAIVAVFFVLGFLLVRMGRNQGADTMNRRPLAPGMLDFPILACTAPVKEKAKPGNVSWNTLSKMVTDLGSIY
jgi:hypothetical protein